MFPKFQKRRGISLLLEALSEKAFADFLGILSASSKASLRSSLQILQAGVALHWEEERSCCFNCHFAFASVSDEIGLLKCWLMVSN
ncbi:hypothetical protein VNO77_44171 [Canavalia gladiata]|uniref:Uncharacterized protein n=1 Tax=Canavalia gladiata TaxID=3824 RepID=A0AAN9PNJ8_CANGL